MPIFIPDYLSRPAPTDDIATHTDTEGKGGYRIVSDLVERDAIVSSHRKFGMLVFCESDQQIYKLGIGLTNLDWEIFTASGGGLTPTAIQTSAYTANSNELVLCDTSGGGFTITLPAIPTNGMKVGLLDITNSFSDTNPLTIDPGANEILSVVDTLQITIGRSAITFMAVDNGGVLGWHILDSIPNLSGANDYNYLRTSGLVQSSYTAETPIIFANAGTSNGINLNTTTGEFTVDNSGEYVISFFMNTNVTASNVRIFENGIDTTQSVGSSDGTASGFITGAGRTLTLNTGNIYTIRGSASWSAVGSNNWLCIEQIVKHVNIRGTANLDLSLTEINTGKKSFDGKDRYTKVINLGTIASGGVNFPHGIVGIDRVIDQYVIAKNTVSPYNQFKITGYQTTATDYVYVSDTEIRVNIITGTLYNCYAILEYTKV